MAELVACIDNLRDYQCEDKRKLQSKSTLYTVLNDPTTTAKDIVKWCWQIAKYAFDFCETFSYSLHPIDVYSARINFNGDIIMETVFRRKGESLTDNYLVTVNSMIGSYSIMLKNVDKKNKTKEIQRELQILDIVFQHTIMNSNLNLYENVMRGAFLIVDKVCELVESGMIVELNNIIMN